MGQYDALCALQNGGVRQNGRVLRIGLQMAEKARQALGFYRTERVHAKPNTKIYYSRME